MDRLATIDTATLDDLARIKAEEETLLARLERLEARREATSPPVFTRIEGDYRQRLGELAAEARPLKERAAQAFQRLGALQETLAAEAAAARLDLEEQEVRHAVGELDDETFAARLQAAEATVREREGVLAEAEALRERFVGAVRDGAELELPDPTPPLPEPLPEPEPSGDPERITWPAASAEVLLPPDVAPESLVELASEPEPETEDDGTVILPRQTAEEEAGQSRSITLRVSPARIICQEEGYEEEYLLAPSTLIGRNFECQIRIAHPALSRRHAQIDLQPDGSYLLIDLGSENGTLVNGIRVSEYHLIDGDLLDLGTLRFLFRSE
ncbi:MAG TPA: FHA domain-containing protein [Thermoanaerobaculia bacterium]|nr:FHA domain-containing protein [Thermoanaerobaculia bacterium]MDI9631593.1 FHA domain-containing protein [Acidobacteriota bacterium]MBP7813352.1 FHA domain-containing protein [Thermoanaerobaculia bacterium]HNU82510.1 FHA domain-containing protein [Thermoanaerobaculia bacterium]HNZ95789.1 FHA domain-containing protein [Thermoanaerobaculia bacterium]